MRYVKVLILRLLVEPASPDVLRGSVQVVGENEQHPFTDGAALLALLRELALAGPERPDSTLPGADS